MWLSERGIVSKGDNRGGLVATSVSSVYDKGERRLVTLSDFPVGAQNIPVYERNGFRPTRSSSAVLWSRAWIRQRSLQGSGATRVRARCCVPVIAPIQSGAVPSVTRVSRNTSVRTYAVCPVRSLRFDARVLCRYPVHSKVPSGSGVPLRS